MSKHIGDNKYCFDFENVRILDKELNNCKRLISEILFINSYNFTINKMEDV